MIKTSSFWFLVDWVYQVDSYTASETFAIELDDKLAK